MLNVHFKVVSSGCTLFPLQTNLTLEPLSATTVLRSVRITGPILACVEGNAEQLTIQTPLKKNSRKIDKIGDSLKRNSVKHRRSPIREETNTGNLAMKKPVVSALDRVPVFGVLYGYPVILSSTTFTCMRSTSHESFLLQEHFLVGLV